MMGYLALRVHHWQGLVVRQQFLIRQTSRMRCALIQSMQYVGAEYPLFVHLDP